MLLHATGKIFRTVGEFSCKQQLEFNINNNFYLCDKYVEYHLQIICILRNVISKCIQRKIFNTFSILSRQLPIIFQVKIKIESKLIVPILILILSLLLSYFYSTLHLFLFCKTLFMQD